MQCSIKNTFKQITKTKQPEEAASLFAERNGEGSAPHPGEQAEKLGTVEVVLLCAEQLAFSQMRRIRQTFGEQSCRRFCVFLHKRLLGQFHAANLVLSRHLAFTPLPRMEAVGIEFPHGFFITAQLVEQCDFLQHEVVAPLNQGWVLPQEIQTLLMRVVQTLVQLVKFHEHPLIVRVE